MPHSIRLNTDRANALITGLMAAYGDLQTAKFNAVIEGRGLDAELTNHRIAVCDGLISDILSAFNVDGWQEIPQGNDCCKPSRGIQ